MKNPFQKVSDSRAKNGSGLYASDVELPKAELSRSIKAIQGRIEFQQIPHHFIRRGNYYS